MEKLKPCPFCGGEADGRGEGVLLKPIKVLSLFDGISCGMVALERAGIPVERYVAYEIDKYAIKVSEKNYPQIEHCGDVFDGDFTQYKGFDLLIGGSPCTYWSIAKKGRETTPDGLGGQLFMQYVRALKESGCKWFLYENNYSIHKDIKAFISEQLGVEPITINSALVSAQQRKRCYWTNIPNVTQPEDKGILLKDVIESGLVWTGKSYAYTCSSCRGILKDASTRHRHSLVAEPVGGALRGIYKESGNRHVKCEGGTIQVPEVRKDGKANCITCVQKDSMVVQPVRVGEIGKGGQGQRIYSVEGKSICLSALGGGQGAKTGLYAIEAYDFNKPLPLGVVGESRQGYTIYSVRGKSVSLCAKSGGIGSNTGLYYIDLPDGEYIIRKLSPIEAERLQTLPDNYTEGISNTQRYKCIGNGWTVDVIAHILKGMKEVNKWIG